MSPKVHVCNRSEVLRRATADESGEGTGGRAVPAGRVVAVRLSCGDTDRPDLDPSHRQETQWPPSTP